MRLLILTALTLTASASEVAYREIFSTGPDPITNGWHYYVSSKAWISDKNPCWGAAPGAGATTAINSLAPQEQVAEGWKGFIWLSPNAPCYLFWSEECRFEPGSVQELSWRFAAKDPEAIIRAAVRVDQLWYASNKTITGATATTMKEAPEYSVKIADTTWIPFTVKKNGSLPEKLEGTGAALPAGHTNQSHISRNV